MLRARASELPARCVSDYRFDRWHTGELSPAEGRAIEAHLKACGRCRDRDRELRALAEEFLQRFPAPLDAESGSTRGRPARFSRWVAWGSGGLALAAAAGWLVLAPAPRAEVSGPLLPGGDSASLATRLKGGARLSFFVKRADRVLEGHDGYVVHPGDRLRFALTTLEPRHVAIVSRDGHGQVSEYFPGTSRSQRVGVSRNRLLDSSVELDGVLGEERIIAVFCNEPFSVAPLREALTQGDTLPVASSCSLDSLTIRKTAP
jgi:hypothetical protein